MRLRSSTKWFLVLFLVVIGAGAAIAVSVSGTVEGDVPLAVGQALRILEPEWLDGELPATLPPTIHSPYVSRPNREFTAVDDTGTAFSVAAELATGDQVAFKLPVANQSQNSMVCQLEMALPAAVTVEVYNPDASFIESVMRVGPTTWKFALPGHQESQELDYIIVVIAADDAVPFIDTISGVLTPSDSHATIIETMELTVSGGLPHEASVLLDSLAPASDGAAVFTLGNISHVSGELSIAFTAMTNIGASGSTEYEDGQGDLGEAVMVALYMDNDQSGTWNTGDTGLKYDGTTYVFPAALDYATFNSYDSAAWADVTVIPPLGYVDFVISWVVPASAGNDIQGDSVRLDITFTLEEVVTP